MNCHINIISGFGPRSDHDTTDLHVPGPVGVVHVADRVEGGGRDPEDGAVVLDDGVRRQVELVV